MSKKVQCTHIWKLGPGAEGECGRFLLPDMGKGPKERVYLGRGCRLDRWERVERRCCWYCPHLEGCPYPSVRCSEAKLLKKSGLEPAVMVNGRLY